MPKSPKRPTGPKLPKAPKAPPVPAKPKGPAKPPVKKTKAKPLSTGPKPLPPIPDVVHTAVGPIRVTWADGLTEREGCVGKFEWRERVITLDRKLSPHSAWMTFRHEMAHAWFMDNGMTIPHELEERLADCIGAALVYEMTH